MVHRLSLGAIMRTELFMYFCIKKYIGTQGAVCRQLKIFLNPSVVYATDRSKAVVLVLFLFCVALRFTLRGASCFKVFPCSLSSCFFLFLLALLSTRLRKREQICVLLVNLIDCFVRVSFCHFSLPLGVGCCLRFVIVALPGLFY